MSTFNHVLDVATLWAYVVTTVGGVVFIARYRRLNWRAHPWGRNVMTFITLIVVILGISLARRFIGDFPLRRALFCAASLAFTVAMWRRVYLVLRRPDQQEPPRERVGRDENISG